MHLPKNLCKDPRVSGPRRGTADTASIVTCALLAGGSHWAISLMAWSTSGTRPAPRMKLCLLDVLDLCGVLVFGSAPEAYQQGSNPRCLCDVPNSFSISVYRPDDGTASVHVQQNP